MALPELARTVRWVPQRWGPGSRRHLPRRPEGRPEQPGRMGGRQDGGPAAAAADAAGRPARENPDKRVTANETGGQATKQQGKQNGTRQAKRNGNVSRTRKLCTALVQIWAILSSEVQVRPRKEKRPLYPQILAF